MEWLLGVPAIILLVLGLVGQGFEMRKMRLDTNPDELSSQNVFTDKRNFKWYGMIGLGILLWYMAERM